MIYDECSFLLWLKAEVSHLGPAYLHDGGAIKPWEPRLSGLHWLATRCMCSPTSLLGEVSDPCVIPLRGYLEAYIWLVLDFAHVPFPFADSVLYPFFDINYNCDCNSL